MAGVQVVTDDQIQEIESIAIGLGDGVAFFYPPSAPVIALIKAFITGAQDLGVVPHELSVEQAREMAAHEAAALASAVTSYKAHHPEGGKAP